MRPLLLALALAGCATKPAAPATWVPPEEWRAGARRIVDAADVITGKPFAGAIRVTLDAPDCPGGIPYGCPVPGGVLVWYTADPLDGDLAGALCRAALGDAEDRVADCRLEVLLTARRAISD